ncbi:uncharacterized protein LOC119303073 isoform X2 [Triticum dicoccoides]|uniref:uncharacterized protein LOC119303073 isoform X2 n=1 Tax=Triticum dicoccoides TaxID=85692 RepID=UPI001890289C|nr:uncharacterized protein LOC119303073 isoform X2 [Triticum dicoccoides]
MWARRGYTPDAKGNFCAERAVRTLFFTSRGLVLSYQVGVCPASRTASLFRFGAGGSSGPVHGDSHSDDTGVGLWYCRSMGAASDSVVRGVHFVSGPAVADSAVGVESRETLPVYEVPPARGLVGDLSDVELSDGSCTTGAAPAGGGVASAGAGDGARAVDSRSAVQSFSPSAPAAASTTIRVGWKRRPRVARAPDERAAVVGRVPALEAAIRGLARRTDVVVNPSMAEAYEFYNLYSWEVGFGIRYGKSRQNVNGTKCMQEIVCGCAGKPERENSSSLRSDCAAMVRLHRTDDGGWYVLENCASHNHELLRTCAEKLHWPSHRHIDTYTKDLCETAAGEQCESMEGLQYLWQPVWANEECTVHEEVP